MSLCKNNESDQIKRRDDLNDESTVDGLKEDGSRPSSVVSQAQLCSKVYLNCVSEVQEQINYLPEFKNTSSVRKHDGDNRSCTIPYNMNNVEIDETNIQMSNINKRRKLSDKLESGTDFINGTAHSSILTEQRIIETVSGQSNEANLFCHQEIENQSSSKAEDNVLSENALDRYSELAGENMNSILMGNFEGNFSKFSLSKDTTAIDFHINKSEEVQSQYLYPCMNSKGSMSVHDEGKAAFSTYGYSSTEYQELKREDLIHDESTDISSQVLQIYPERAPVCSSRRKLLVLDVNGLLADIVSNLPSWYRPDTYISGRGVFKRPFCEDFLQFCFERFDVGVWSSRSKRNVYWIIDFIMGKAKEKLLFCWDQSHCTDTGFNTVENRDKPLVLKELKKLWEKHEPSLPWEKGQYNASNTLLLDDSPHKALRNPPNTAIFPYPYRYKDVKDYSLGPGGDLRVYLEGLALADDVQKYVKQNPFGQRPITEKNISWRFYLKVIGAASSEVIGSSQPKFHVCKISSRQEDNSGVTPCPTKDPMTASSSLPKDHIFTTSYLPKECPGTSSSHPEDSLVTTSSGPKDNFVTALCPSEDHIGTTCSMQEDGTDKNSTPVESL